MQICAKNEDNLKSREMIFVILLGSSGLLNIILLIVIIVGVKHCKESSWRSVLLVEEIGVPGEKHPPVASL
jgi:hypothetical protein